MAGAWEAAVAAWMRSASVSVKTTDVASVAVISVLRRLMAVASVDPPLSGIKSYR